MANLEYFPGSIPFKAYLAAHDRAKELAKLYWLPFVITSGTDNRWHVEVFVPPPGHDNRTETIRTFTGGSKQIIYPPQEPTGAHRAQTMDDSVEIQVTVKRVTEKAFLVEAEDYENKTIEAWIPKSQVVETDCLAEGDEGTMEMSRWIALQKDLIEEEDD